MTTPQQSAENHYKSALKLQEQGELTSAAAEYEKALKIAPTHPAVLANLGACYGRMGETDKALKALLMADKSKPGDWRILSMIGEAFYHAGAYDNALRALGAATKLQPQALEAHLYAGLSLEKLGKIADAITALRRAAGPELKHAAALKELARIHTRRDEPEAEFQAAIAAWRAAPDRLDYNVQARFTAQQAGAWELLEDLDAGFEDRVKAYKTGELYLGEPFTAISRTESRAVQLAMGRSRSDYLLRQVSGVEGYRDHPKPRRDGPLRIGYLSADFHSHATMHLMAGVFREHDPAKVVFYCYSHGPDDDSAYRTLLLERAAGFREIRKLSTAEAAEIIRQDELDLLVDLKGHTRDSRVEICALRPAPVQATWLGYPGTLGADFIDYAITDEIVAPDAHLADFSEVLAHHPVCYQPNDDQQEALKTTPSRSELGLPSNGAVFCSFNRAYKVDPVRFASWMEILKGVEGSVLWLMEENPMAAAAWRTAAEAAGVSPERLIFADKAPKAAHLARLRQADLALDTRIYNGHTTSTDMLHAGVPVLATSGDHFASRVSASLLQAAGASELVCDDETSFIAKGVELGSDRKALAALKDKIAVAKETAPIFNSKAYTAALEDLYGAMVKRGGRPNDRTPIRIA